MSFFKKFTLFFFIVLNLNSKLIENISKDEFERLKTIGENFFVDVYAYWCGPCQKMLPIFIELSNSNEFYNLIFVTINIDSEFGKEFITNYQISSVPTFLYIKNNQIFWKHSGGIQKKNFIEKINNLK